MPSRGLGAVQAVTRTIVSPDRTMTEPSACLARRPVSIEMVLPAYGNFTCMHVCLSIVELRQLPMVRLMRLGLEAATPGTLASRKPEPAATSRLLPDTEALDQLGVAIRILAFQVVQQAPPLTDQLEKAAARVMIFRVGLEMLGEVIDALAEERDLYLGGSGIGCVGFVGSDDF